MARACCNYIVDADVEKFFDRISHDWLLRFLEHRIGDARILRLIRKWLKAGVMEDGTVTQAETGTPQGGRSSPRSWPTSICTTSSTCGHSSGDTAMLTAT